MAEDNVVDIRPTLARTGFARGDKVATPEGDGVIRSGVSSGERNEDRYYWVDLGEVGDDATCKRFEADQLPDPAEEN